MEEEIDSSTLKAANIVGGNWNNGAIYLYS
jgi:hypothetical protein